MKSRAARRWQCTGRVGMMMFRGRIKQSVPACADCSLGLACRKKVWSGGWREAWPRQGRAGQRGNKDGGRRWAWALTSHEDGIAPPWPLNSLGLSDRAPAKHSHAPLDGTPVAPGGLSPCLECRGYRGHPCCRDEGQAPVFALTLPGLARIMARGRRATLPSVRQEPSQSRVASVQLRWRRATSSLASVMLTSHPGLRWAIQNDRGEPYPIASSPGTGPMTPIRPNPCFQQLSVSDIFVAPTGHTDDKNVNGHQVAGQQQKMESRRGIPFLYVASARLDLPGRRRSCPGVLPELPPPWAGGPASRSPSRSAAGRKRGRAACGAERWYCCDCSTATGKGRGTRVSRFTGGRCIRIGAVKRRGQATRTVETRGREQLSTLRAHDRSLSAPLGLVAGAGRRCWRVRRIGAPNLHGH